MNEEQETTEDGYSEIDKKPLSVNPKRTEHKRKSKWALYLGAGITVAGLGVGSYYAYDYYVHADDVTVPQAQKFVEDVNLENDLCKDFQKLEIKCDVEWELNDKASRGNLLSQSIAPGTVVSPSDSSVVITYSDGPSNSVFPNLSGQDLEESKATLYKMGVIVSDVKEVDNNTVPNGRIVSTSIEPGTNVEHGTEVVIEISNGQSIVPDWIGETKEFVEADAQSKNLEVSFEMVETEDTAPGIVINQDVKAGEVIKEGTVKVTIATSPVIDSVSIPDLKGMTEEEAVSQLAAIGFTNITIIAVETSDVEERTVIDISPGINQKVETDSLITLVITEPLTSNEEDATPEDES